MEYLEFISSHHNDPYWQEILNTSYDMLPHKFEILMSELSKNRYEIKKVVIENLDDYLSSKETALKLLLEIEKHKVFTKSATEIFTQDQLIISKCDVGFFEGVHSFFIQNSTLFEMDSFLNIVKKQSNDENLEKITTFLKNACQTISLSSENKGKLLMYFNKIAEKTRGIIFSNILSQDQKKQQNGNALSSISSLYSNLKPEDFAQQLFKLAYKNVLLEKLEKYRPLKGSNDYLIKIFGIHSKSLESSLETISTLYAGLKTNEKGLNLIDIKAHQNYFKAFEDNFSDLIKNSSQDESFIRLLQSFKQHENAKSAVLMLLGKLIEEHFQKILGKFREKLNLLNRYCYLNNMFSNLLQKVDNNYFDDFSAVANDAKIQRNDKIQKMLIFARKNEIFSLILNNVVGIYQFAMLYLKDKFKIGKLNKFLVENLKIYFLETQGFLEKKRKFGVEERTKIIKKIERFLQIIYFMIENNCLES